MNYENEQRWKEDDQQFNSEGINTVERPVPIKRSARRCKPRLPGKPSLDILFQPPLDDGLLPRDPNTPVSTERKIVIQSAKLKSETDVKVLYLKRHDQPGPSS